MIDFTFFKAESYENFYRSICNWLGKAVVESKEVTFKNDVDMYVKVKGFTYQPTGGQHIWIKDTGVWFLKTADGEDDASMMCLARKKTENLYEFVLLDDFGNLDVEMTRAFVGFLVNNKFSPEPLEVHN